MKIGIGNDHAAVAMKNELRKAAIIQYMEKLWGVLSLQRK